MFLACLACLIAIPTTSSHAAAAPSRPNIVLIMADDVSPDLFGCYGCEDARTPNLDRMAREGIMFRSAWGSAICSPARAEIMTGRYATRTGYWNNGFSIPQADGTNRLFQHHRNFGELMRGAGYATAVAGKWHVGGEHPSDPTLGFDEYCLWEGRKELAALPDQPEHTGAWEDDSTPSRYWHPCIVRNHRLMPTGPDDFGPDLFTEFLCDFIGRSVRRNQPFLAYYPMVAPHGTREGQTTCPLYGEPGDMVGTKEDHPKRFRALNDYIDVLVGRIEARVRQLGVSDNTIFIFCADNGTAVTAKSRGVERGCRIPMIVFGRGITPRGPTSEICDFSDILPTLVDFAGGKTPKDYPLDGKSLKPFVTGRTETHRDYILACIGTTRLVRTRTHLLEVVNPILGVPRGRFYFCGDSHDGHGYVRAEGQPEHVEVRRRLDEILAAHPGLTADHPRFDDPRAARWLREYASPESREKHLHNHRDYQFYDEEIEP